MLSLQIFFFKIQINKNVSISYLIIELLNNIWIIFNKGYGWYIKLQITLNKIVGTKTTRAVFINIFFFCIIWWYLNLILKLIFVLRFFFLCLLILSLYFSLYFLALIATLSGLFFPHNFLFSLRRSLFFSRYTFCCFFIFFYFFVS